jgi:hypothetical protein
MAVRSLDEYREWVEQMRGGAVPAETVLEIIALAEAELLEAHGEVTLTQAVRDSGRSRSWWTRRLTSLAARRLARKSGGVWLIRAAAVPTRETNRGRGFDPDLSADEIARRLVA